jgi:hypothetical protein
VRWQKVFSAIGRRQSGDTPDMREVKGPVTPPKFGPVGTASDTSENAKIEGLVDEMEA